MQVDAKYMSEFSHRGSSESLTYSKRRGELYHPGVSLLLMCQGLEVKLFEVVLSRGTNCRTEVVTFS